MARIAAFALKPLMLAAALLVTIPGFTSGPGPGHKAGAEKVLRQVKLIVEPERLLASNTRLNRLDQQELQGGEQYLRHAESEAAIVVATNQRILAYGPVIGWRSIQLLPGETIESLQAEDYAVFIITNLRYLNFNADTGLWGREQRAGGS